MEVQVLMLMKEGVVVETHVVKNEGTAEAVFESLGRKALGDEDYNDIAEDYYSYDDLFPEINKALQSIGMEIIWQIDIELNTFE